MEKYSRAGKQEYDFGVIKREGDGIATYGNGFIVRNNYVHHTIQCGITIESFEKMETISGTRIDGNLVEYCLSGICFYNWERDNPNHIYKDCRVTNNIFLGIGEQDHYWKREDFEYQGMAVVFFCSQSINEDCLIANNIFGPEGNKTTNIVDCNVYNAKYRKIFSGNTYIQAKKDSPAIRAEGVVPEKMNLSSKVIKELLGDKTGKVYRME